MGPKLIARYARMMRACGIETLELDGVRIRLAPVDSVPAAPTGASGKQQSAAEQAAAQAASGKRTLYAHTGRVPT
jgi:hypothetical protein